MMTNVLIPLAGASKFFEDARYHFPKPLIEIRGKSMIELVIENIRSTIGDCKFIFVVKESDCEEFSLDLVLKLLTDDRCEIVKIGGDTMGAACSCLMAIDYIQNDDELVVLNGDQIIESDYSEILNGFRQQGVDAGVVTFESVHPRWSFVKVLNNGEVVEVSEKKPISKNAVAGFYYFRRGDEFVTAAMRMIKKDNMVNNMFFISPALNELVLLGKNICMSSVDSNKYFSFYSPQKIEEFEALHEKI